MSRADDVAALRTYAVREGEWAVPLAVHELHMSERRVKVALAELLRLGIVRQVAAPVRGHLGGPAIYGHAPIPTDGVRVWHHADDNAPVADLAPARGAEVAYTGKAKGWGDHPKATRDKQLRGHRVRRKRNGT